MLIRFLIKNLFSFKELTEFNMLPGRFSRLPHHVYKVGEIELLKLNAIYGANGAGKSNLIRAISLLQDFITTGELPIEFLTETFKFENDNHDKEIYLGIEFLKEEVPYYYGLKINQGIVVEEELQISGLGKINDKNIFTRTDNVNAKDLKLIFSDEVTNDKEASIFPTFLKNEMLERNKSVLFYMRNRQNAVFEPFKKALEWFSTGIIPILPYSKPRGLVLQLEQNERFFEFASSVMKSFCTGIHSINVETIPIEEFFGEDDKKEAERISSELKANPAKVRPLMTEYEEIMFVWKNDKAYAKRLYYLHSEDGGKRKFTSAEESDGTLRLMDYLPALFKVINTSEVYLVDEIERSIHPVLIKELIKKFSHDNSTKGQLIFTTHESNLLDQDIFRPDEIWFAEKKKEGSTELYPLSEFKEHHTIDIRKGYLNGRYGAIPFLGNLRDLNWEKYAEAN
jgi:AAA15 family ATPase/GTPase